MTDNVIDYRGSEPFDDIGFTVQLMTICLDKAAASYFVTIKAFIVALMQYTADTQDYCSALALKAQPCRGNESRMVGVMHYRISHPASIYSNWLQSASTLRLASR